MDVILLERVESLGNMGEKVRVKPGYARNYLLPQGKALRATADNIAYFESQRAALEKLNAEKRVEAEKIAKKLEGLKVSMIRNAAEGGQLYGSVTARDIADAINAAGKAEVARNMVVVNQNFKTIGLFEVPVVLHPEVKVAVTINIARSEEEAKVQAKTGKAVVVDYSGASETTDAKSALLDADALAAEAARNAEESAEAAKDAAKSAAKSAKRAGKKADKAESDAEEDVADE
ncbi:MAG: 50S ribosomal protein L9 [Micavibrio aeruginosavorus]|uniref:Large ribosomal subunit protein bL9 n=1 Tax=Micavibrio aeruginosavorus TaxID=349221 RepID=A0A7T5R4D7_9BACT|nr:MAG: 50S ribosomal protein L9 [Micavibrio aeruginosavorus]